jgi:hypothetical protein
MDVTDSYGLVKDNEFLTVYIPLTNRAFVFRVLARTNALSPVFNYGPLPLTSGESLNGYDGGTVSVPADGVMPGRAYTRSGKSFSLTGAIEESDMFYLPKDYNERLFHVIQYVTPSFLRVDVQIPTGVPQGRFQRDRVLVGIDADFGFRRGSIETVHFPEIHYGYRYGNDTNMALYTHVKFVYGEYVIEIPKNAELIYAILTKKVPSHWVTLQLGSYDSAIVRGFRETYNFEGFRLYGIHQRDIALSEYSSLINQVRP